MGRFDGKIEFCDTCDTFFPTLHAQKNNYLYINRAKNSGKVSQMIFLRNRLERRLTCGFSKSRMEKPKEKRTCRNLSYICCKG